MHGLPMHIKRGSKISVILIDIGYGSLYSLRHSLQSFSGSVRDHKGAGKKRNSITNFGHNLSPFKWILIIIVGQIVKRLLA